jgi:hypothetical protein
MKLLPNHTVYCCDPDCVMTGVTSRTAADLPLGWTFRHAPGVDEDSVQMVIYCPKCSKAREETRRSFGEG